MATNYTPIPQSVLNQPASITQPSPCYTSVINEESSAFLVMTDLRLIAPATTTEQATLTEANQQMIDRGVRMLLVLDQTKQLSGIITSNDLLGEKPLKHTQRHRCTTCDIKVKDLMIPLGAIEILDYSDIQSAKVGDIIATLKQSGRHHALIADFQDNGTCSICGTFSLSHISQMLNTQVAMSRSQTTQQILSESRQHH